jgi:ADP-heptose:LPS heptosyltransferase
LQQQEEYTLLCANKRVSFSRKHSDLQEAQLNFKLLKPLGFDFIPELNEIPGYYGLRVGSAISFFSQGSQKINLIIHPGSKGSARDWSINNYVELIRLLPQDRFNVFISGTQKEANIFLPAFADVSDRFTVIPGAYGLDQFMGIIAAADVLLAASTGPLHLAAALDIHAIGIYVPMRPIHPGRWAPLGKKAEVICADKICGGCKKGEPCSCIAEISPEMVRHRLMQVEKVSIH